MRIGCSEGKSIPRKAITDENQAFTTNRMVYRSLALQRGGIGYRRLRYPVGTAGLT